MPSHNMKQNSSSLKTLVDISHCSIECLIKTLHQGISQLKCCMRYGMSRKQSSANNGTGKNFTIPLSRILTLLCEALPALRYVQPLDRNQILQSSTEGFTNKVSLVTSLGRKNSPENSWEESLFVISPKNNFLFSFTCRKVWSWSLILNFFSQSLYDILSLTAFTAVFLSPGPYFLQLFPSDFSV